MSKIILANRYELDHPILWNVYNQYPQHDWQSFINVSKYNNWSEGNLPRAGLNNFPFKNEISKLPGFGMPEYNPQFSMSFDQVTDLRFHQLQKDYSDKTWLVQWSGGVDSTLIVASILKNLSPNNYDQIVIACNRQSVYENPLFFYNYIEPNFKLIDSSNLKYDYNLFNDYLVITGEPGDELCMPEQPSNLLFFQEFDNHKRDFRKDPDRLLSYISSFSGMQTAKWFYERVIENIDSVNIPMETYYDFFWWAGFNYYWIDNMHIMSTNQEIERSATSLNLIFNKLAHWYNTTEYQQWAMVTRRAGSHYGSDLGGYKLALKEYIYSVDHNEYYLKFKTKSISSTRHVIPRTWFCILDDLTRLSLDKDLDQILELLPDFIQT
jgi:hypothetical protein